jgi:hypothetical protein
VIGVVACEALYSEVERICPDARIKYVPQGLHEFPTNVPLTADIEERLRTAIDRLDSPDLDRIVVVYANHGGDVGDPRPVRTPVLLSRPEDCVSLFLPGSDATETGERKEFGTYYLTRGVIDCGVDSYKLYAAYRGRTDELVAEFEEARKSHPDLRVTWADGERFDAAVDRQRSLSEETVGRFFHEILQYYERVKLVDTGGLYEHHHEYAETFRAFVERLSADHGDGHGVELSVTDGDVSRLEGLLDPAGSQSLRDDKHVDVYRPDGAID